ncbi:flagellar basal body-associated protein FliL [Allocatelliglobosispora scoriae]|uniref:Flagellar basal body-associated protein FliL n=1 Tax=Allocatelliglobosispora scoriae TaxID=643052 RepID=A0A841BVV4_9ACTN|nr:Stk1 family PASTA domain-containing Ser/Thr kinase [Allocatelliglobosispora scoriae]MBB5871053.1 flagellar basal body-associated protein FliL [Allocatelliglobosispora scoriae]
MPAPSAGDQTTVLPTPPAGDRTGPGASEHTSVLPAAGADPWLGRAEVGGPPVRGAVPPPDEAEDGEPEPGGTWWLPVVIAVVGLLLLLAIGVGIWLVASNSDDPEPTPSPSRPVPSTVSTTSAPTPSPVATSAGVANIPPVVGLTLNDATKALDAVGLNYRLEYRATNDAASGTVIGVDPKAGTQVPAGYEVLLLIASTPPPSPSPSPSEEEEESPSPLASAS